MSKTSRVAEKIANRIPPVRAAGGVDAIRNVASGIQEGRAEAGGSMELARELAKSLPDLGKLIFSLAKDSSVKLRHRMALVGAIGLAISPIDAVPDFIPVIGQLDDIVLILLSVRLLLTKVPMATIEEHWQGKQSTLDLLLQFVGRESHVDAAHIDD